MGRSYWRASALAGLFGLIISAGMGVDLAAAHPGDEDQTDAEHAKQDLADTSIEQIEKETRANATKIKKATGDTPGRQHGGTDGTQRAASQLSRLRIPVRAVNGARSCRPASCRFFRPCCRTARC